VSHTDQEAEILRNVKHEPGCKWFDDDDWGSAAFANYVALFGDVPPCTCIAGENALRDNGE